MENKQSNGGSKPSKINQSYRDDYAKFLLELQEVNNLTQQELAKTLGLKKSYICSCQKGRNNLSIECYQRIRKAYDLSLEEIDRLNHILIGK